MFMLVSGVVVACAIGFAALFDFQTPEPVALIAQIQDPPPGLRLRLGENTPVRIRVGGGTQNNLRWVVTLQRRGTADVIEIAAGGGAVEGEVGVLVADDLISGQIYTVVLTVNDTQSTTGATAEVLVAAPSYSLIPLVEGNLSQLLPGVYGTDASGDLLLYTGPSADPMQLLLLDRPSGGRELLRVAVWSTESVQFSGDGSRLFYRGAFPLTMGPVSGAVSGMGFLDLDTRELSLIDRDGTNFYSTDAMGKRVVYQSIVPDNTLQYFLYDETTGTRRQLSDDPLAIRPFDETRSTDCPQILGTRPFISSDGSTVVIITSATLGLVPADEAVGCRVFTYDVASEEWRQTAALPRELVADVPTLSADGRWLSFRARSRPPRLPPVAVLLDLETGALHDPVVDVGSYVTFDSVVTGDGQGIVISTQADLDPRVRNADHNLELFHYDFATRTFTQITETVGGIGSSPGGCPSYRPFVARDGAVLVFYFLTPPVEGCHLDGPMRHERDGFVFRFVRAVRRRPGNRGPLFDPVPDQHVLAGETLTLDLAAHDPDGDPISFFAQVKDGEDVPPGSLITDHYDGTATFTWPTRPEHAGSTVLRVAAFDEGGGEVVQDVTLTVLASDRPTASPTLVASASPTPLPTAPPAACLGDCNGNRQVTIDELLLSTNIALGRTPLAACPAAACGTASNVTIDCLIGAVSNALSGCP